MFASPKKVLIYNTFFLVGSIWWDAILWYGIPPTYSRKLVGCHTTQRDVMRASNAVVRSSL
jgi:hypothetical protein